MRERFAQTGAAAVMLARGALGNPWLFARLLGEREQRADAPRGARELDWTIERAVEHLGGERATRYLRKFYPWYVARLGLDARRGQRLQAALQSAPRWRRRRASERGREPVARAASERSQRPAAPALYCCARWARSAATSPLERGFALSRPTTQPAIEGHMPKDVILTPEGLKKLKDELELLSTEKRREVAERIKEAREFGDISENSEYDDAKNEQAMLESRIAQLQEKLRMATVIQAKDLSTDVVQVGSVVHVKDEKTGKSVKYTIVGSAEAKPRRTSSPTSRPSAAR